MSVLVLSIAVYGLVASQQAIASPEVEVAPLTIKGKMTSAGSWKGIGTVLKGPERRVLVVSSWCHFSLAALDEFKVHPESLRGYDAILFYDNELGYYLDLLVSKHKMTASEAKRILKIATKRGQRLVDPDRIRAFGSMPFYFAREDSLKNLVGGFPTTLQCHASVGCLRGEHTRPVEEVLRREALRSEKEQ
jgi:hypothetical protein